MKKYLLHYVIVFVLLGGGLLLLAATLNRLSTTNGLVNSCTDLFEASAILWGWVFAVVGLTRVRHSGEWKKIIVGLLGMIFGLAIPTIVEICIIGPFKLNVEWDEGPAAAVGRICFWITLPVILIAWLVPKWLRLRKDPKSTEQ